MATTALSNKQKRENYRPFRAGESGVALCLPPQSKTHPAIFQPDPTLFF
jgi:hypothetical protein